MKSEKETIIHQLEIAIEQLKSEKHDTLHKFMLINNYVFDKDYDVYLKLVLAKKNKKPEISVVC